MIVLGPNVVVFADLLCGFGDFLRSIESTSSFIFDPGGRNGLLVHARGVETLVILVFDPRVVHKLDLQAVLIDCCWVLGGLIFVFDPGGMDYPWLQVYGWHQWKVQVQVLEICVQLIFIGRTSRHLKQLGNVLQILLANSLQELILLIKP